MSILWVCNAPTSELSNYLNIKYVSGSWIESALNPLKTQGKDIIYLWVAANTKKIEKVVLNKNIYYLMPSAQSVEEYGKLFKELFKKESFDLVHIWGTELLHSLACVEICEQLQIKSVISIQGLIRNCSIAYDIKIPTFVRYRFSLFEIIRKNTFNDQVKRFKINGENEEKIIEKAKYIIGRTHWDKENALLINPSIKYYHCDENLRDEFYGNDKWKYDECEKNSIFISQASYSLKGFHLFLQAIYQVKKRINNIKVYVAGYNIIESHGIKSKINKGTYKKYLISLIKKYRLEDNIIFLGPLSPKKMKKYYLKANVFCSCSFMENSSNSISEAMILGVPVISSFVGGVSSLADNRRELLFYSAYDYFHLASLILEIFGNPQLAMKLSDNSIIRAEKRHDVLKNTSDLISIYDDILF